MKHEVRGLALALAWSLALHGCGDGPADVPPATSADAGVAQDAPGAETTTPDAAAPDGQQPDSPADVAQDDAFTDVVIDGSHDVVVPLEVLEVEPPQGAVVARNRPFRIVFANEVDRSTLSVDINGLPVALVSSNDSEFRYTPLPLFDADTDYTVRIAAGLSDLSGAVLQQDWVTSFRTNAETVEVDGDPAWTTLESDYILSGAVHEPMDLVQDYGEPASALYAINPPVQQGDAITDHLVERMFTSMVHHGGIGLAAPQIGIGRRLFVARIGGVDRAFLNPVLTDHADETDSYIEGCLSVPGKNTQVLRPIWIEFAYVEVDGTPVSYERVENGTAIHARVWLHEFDHLNGILLLDRKGH